MRFRAGVVRNLIFAILAGLMFICVVVFFIRYDSRQWHRDNEPYRSLFFTAPSGSGHDIELICIDEQYYAFIPSEYGSRPVVRLRYADSVTIDGVEYRSGDTIDLTGLYSGASAWTDLPGDTADSPAFLHMIVRDHSDMVCEGDICFLYAGDVASLYIDTSSGSMEAVTASEDHTYSELADLYCMDQENLYAGRCTIRGRGNTTWGPFPKKPYNIEFTDDVSLLGMSAQSKWTLLANVFDGSEMKNYLALDVAYRMEMPVSVECRYANLYLNGEYAGLYLITQHVDVTGGNVPIYDLGAENRLINDYRQTEPEWEFYSNSDWRSIEWYEGSSPDEISGGYLVEFVQYGTPGSGFFTTYHNMGIIESPRYHTYDESIYMLEYLLKVEDLIYNDTSDSYSRYLDKDSWATMYLLKDFFADEDTDLYSLYAYKDRGSDTFICGPAWDFDATMGIDRESKHAESAQTRWLRNRAESNRELGLNEGWLNQLYEGHEDFRQVVCDKYVDDFSVIIRDELDHVLPAIYDVIADSAYMDHIRYPHRVRPSYDEGFDAEYAYMISWLENRLIFYDELFE